MARWQTVEDRCEFVAGVIHIARTEEGSRPEGQYAKHLLSNHFLIPGSLARTSMPSA